MNMPVTPEAELILARKTLDAQFVKWRKVSPGDGPKKGWVRTVRQALGMTPKQLGARTGMSLSSISKAELSEMDGTIQFATLQRLAKGLNCRLVYALVSEEPLEKVVERRKRRMAAKDLHAIGAKLSYPQMQTLISEYVKAIRADKVWERD